MEFFDSRGVRRTYGVSLNDGLLRIYLLVTGLTLQSYSDVLRCLWKRWATMAQADGEVLRPWSDSGNGYDDDTVKSF